MSVNENFVPSSTIGGKVISTGATGQHTNSVPYFRRSDGKLITPQLPFTEAHANSGLVAAGGTLTVLTPPAGKRLWIFKVVIGNGGNSVFGLRFGATEYIVYHANSLQPPPYIDPLNFLPYGILASAVDLALIYINNSAAGAATEVSVLYNLLDD